MSVSRLDDGAFVEVNEPFCALTGWTREELIGRTAVEIGFYGDAQERERLRRRLAEQGVVRQDERPFRTRSGQVREALRYGETVTYGGETYLLSQVIDITDRKRMEASLHKSQQTLRTIFDNTQQSFMLLDRHRRIRAYNRAANEHSRQLTGQNLQEGDLFDRYVAPEARTDILESVNRALQGICHVAQRELSRHDGQRRWSEAHYDPVRSDQGEVTGVFIGVLDITHRKSVERALHDSEIKLQAIFDNSLQSFILLDRDRRICMFNRIADARAEQVCGRRLREGDPIDPFVLPEHRSDFDRGFRSALLGQADSRELRFVDTDDGTRWFDVHFSPAYDEQGHIFGVFHSLSEITHRKQVQQEVERRLQELMAVHHVSQRLQSLQSLDGLAEAVIDILQETLAYEYGSVLLLDDGGRLLPFALGEWQHCSHLSDSYRSILEAEDLHVDRGVVGWVAQTGQSFRSGHVQQDPRYDAILPDIHSELCVPLKSEGQVIGVVNVETRQPDAYTEPDQRVLEIIASQIAVAIQNAQLYEQVERARDQVTSLSQQLLRAQEDERRSIASELHDEVGQSLTAIKLLLEAKEAQSDDPNDPIDRARGLIDDLISQVRRLSLDLRPAMLDDLGLWPTLQWHVERFQTNTGVHVDLNERGLSERRLASGVETAAYRIVQEALTNVARHAHAKRVRVDLTLDEARLHIDICDHGLGFPANTTTAERTSTGLTGMRERAELLGGTLEVRSAPGAGTRVRCELPARNGPTEVADDDDRDRG